MAHRKSKRLSAKSSSHSRSKSRGKVGTDLRAAREFAGKRDFGAPESDPVERQYVSNAVKSRDRGGVPARSAGEDERTSGVGANASGPGRGSGGDLDPDIVGVGTHGRGIAAAGPDRTEGADITDGSPDTFAGRAK